MKFYKKPGYSGKEKFGNALQSSFGIVVIIFSIFLLMSCDASKRTYGPAVLRIVADNDIHVENIVVKFAAEVPIMEGSRTIFSEIKLADTGVQIVFPVHEFDRVPSAFWVFVCHPMYRCIHVYVRNDKALETANGKIDFGLIKLTNLLSFVADARNNEGNINYMMSGHLIYMGRDYLPVIADRNIDIDRKKFQRYLIEVCEKAKKERNAELIDECNHAGMAKIKRLFSD